MSGCGRSSQDVAIETVALLRREFPEHPTCQVSDVEKILFECVRDCFKQVQSPELALAILGWVCETKRSSLSASNRLGGFIKKCFEGWSREFTTADQENHPRYEGTVDYLCGEADVVVFTPETVYALQPFRAWLGAQIGQHLTNVEVIEEGSNTSLRVEIEPGFKAARLLQIQGSEQPNS